MKNIVLALAMLFVSATIVNAQTKDEKAVTEAVEKLKKALLDGKKDQLEAITAPQLSYGHSSGKIEDRKAFVEALTSGASDFTAMELSDQKITVVGNTALVRHRLDGTSVDNGKPGTVKLGVMLVFEKMKGQWLLLGRQAFKLP